MPAKGISSLNLNHVIKFVTVHFHSSTSLNLDSLGMIHIFACVCVWGHFQKELTKERSVLVFAKGVSRRN